MSSRIPEWAKEFIVGCGRVRYGGKLHLYAVLRKDFMGGQLANFVDFIQYPRFLYLSEEIPQEYRELVLRYELRRYLRYKNMEKGWCRRSLEIEIKEIPVSVKKKKYVQWRLHFFRHHYWYYTEGPGQTEVREEYVSEILGCILFLEQLAKNG